MNIFTNMLLAGKKITADTEKLTIIRNVSFCGEKLLQLITLVLPLPIYFDLGVLFLVYPVC